MDTRGFDRGGFFDEDLYARAVPLHSESQSQSSFTGLAPAGTLLGFVIFACFAWSLVAGDDSTIRSIFYRILYVLQDMASRVSMGLVRRPVPAALSDGSALTSVFGLKTGGAASSLKTLGTDTLQRGIGGIRSIVQGSSSGSEAPAGLGNWDNSCYQNSVIQGLASLRSLPGFLAKVARSTPERDSMNEALLETVVKLNEQANNGKQLWLPQQLKTMSTWQQQDAQEYFSKVLEKVDKEALGVAKQQMEGRRNLGLGEHWLEKNDRQEEEEERLHNPVEGMIAQRVGCKSCGHSDGISLIPFNCLTVPLGNGQLYDIRDCLDEYTKLEEIDGVQCPKCTLLSFKAKLEAMVAKDAASSDSLRQHVEQRLAAVVEALNDDDFSDAAITKKCQIPKKQWVESTKTKQAVVARAPKGLIMHVNRSMYNEYTGAQIKNPAAVRFPMTFGLGHWMIGSRAAAPDAREIWAMEPQKSMLPEFDADGRSAQQVASNARYQLRAVVTHYGRHENGHYVCYRTHPYLSEGEEKASEAWWRLSDDDVAPVGEDVVLRQGGVFMLFYERLDDCVDLFEDNASTAAVLDTVSDVIAEEAAQIPLPADSNDDFDINQPKPSISSATEDTPAAASLPTPAPSTPPPTFLEDKLTPPTNNQLPTPPPSVAESDDLTHILTTTNEASTSPTASTSKQSPPQARAIRMRTGDRGSSESLRMGSRMVSA